MGCNQNGQASTDVETGDVDTKMRMRMMLMMIIYGAHLRIKRFTYPNNSRWGRCITLFLPALRLLCRGCKSLIIITVIKYLCTEQGVLNRPPNGQLANHTADNVRFQLFGLSASAHVQHHIIWGPFFVPWNHKHTKGQMDRQTDGQTNGRTDDHMTGQICDGEKAAMHHLCLNVLMYGHV